MLVAWFGLGGWARWCPARHAPPHLPREPPSRHGLQVFWALELHERSAGCVVTVFVFHVLLSLMVLAWAHTCFTDPGVPPER